MIAHNVQSPTSVTPLAASITGSSCYSLNCSSEPAASAAGWAPAAGVSAVTLAVKAPEKTNGGTAQYSYTLIGVPRTSSNTSRGSSTGGHAPLLMLGTGTPDVSCTGHDSLTVNGTAAVNSSGTPALQTNGTASITASSIYTDTPSSSGAFSGSNITPSAPTQTGVTSADPYAGLSTPITEPIPNGASSPYGGYTIFNGNGQDLATDGPGIYTKAVSINSAETIPSGVYIFQAGLSLSGLGAISSAAGGIFFYVYAGPISITGQGGIDLQPISSPPSPAPNLTIWQDQSDNSGMTLGGNGAAIVIGGTIYAPNVTAGVGGNGSLSIGSLVANSVSCNGGGNSGSITIG